MKRVGNLYERLCDRDIINRAFDEASRGKKNKLYVRPYLENREFYVEKLIYWLKSGTLKLSQNKSKTIYERSARKTREIVVPKFFPDQVVHWAYCIVMHDVFMRGMYKWNCGSIKGRGVHYGIKQAKRVMRSPKAKYTLKTDFSKYFQSVDGDKLHDLVKRKIKDKQMLWLTRLIIDNGTICGKGLPIGYYSSQWFSNFYLERIDHFIKEELHIPFYIRYVDDMVLFDSNKRRLHAARRRIEEKLEKEHYALTFKANWQLWKTGSRPLDFLGFTILGNRQRLRKRSWIALNRVVKKKEKRGYCTVASARGFISRLGWLSRCSNGIRYYQTKIKPILSKGEACRIVSQYDKKQNTLKVAI